MEHYFAVRYGDIVVLLYHENMPTVRDLLVKNSQREKQLKTFLEYCYMIDVKVALKGLKGDKTRGLKAATKYVKDYEIGMSAEQIQEAMSMLQ
ncbi:MAG: hypothetical protein LUC98_13100 [Lachnospiraceae bacterium]|nr:hypothetical protein [Lachnospiraceae bacterium]